VKNDRADARGVSELYARCGPLSAVFCYSNWRGKLLEARLRRGISRRGLLFHTASTTLSRHVLHLLATA
jgi:hypothetical protein